MVVTYFVLNSHGLFDNMKIPREMYGPSIGMHKLFFQTNLMQLVQYNYNISRKD